MLVFFITMDSCYIAAKKREWTNAQKCIFPFLVFYLCVVFSITIVNRLPYDEVRYNLALFWSYEAAAERSYFILEILLNYFMLLPYGVFASFYMKPRNVILSGAMLSLGIEIAQLLMRRGLFEFDDIFGNVIGVILGTLIFTTIRKKERDLVEKVS